MKSPVPISAQVSRNAASRGLDVVVMLPLMVASGVMVGLVSTPAYREAAAISDEVG